jgi:hypothetical protein
MPRGDGTGPNGMGPMSGRAAGFCGGNEVPGYLDPLGPRGRGEFWRTCAGLFSRGRGRGNRRMFFATGLTGWQRAATGRGCAAMDPEQELAALRGRVQLMEAEKKLAEDRIAELQKGGGSKE